MTECKTPIPAKAPRQAPREKFLLPSVAEKVLGFFAAIFAFVTLALIILIIARGFTGAEPPSIIDVILIFGVGIWFGSTAIIFSALGYMLLYLRTIANNTIRLKGD